MTDEERNDLDAITQFKIKLYEMTIQLGALTREKWLQLDVMRATLNKEEDLIREIADATLVLSKMKGFIKK
jgi:hypothetical protein